MNTFEMNAYFWAIITITATVIILIILFKIFMRKLAIARPSATEFEWAVERMSNDMLDQMTSEISVAMDRFRSKVEDTTDLVRLKVEGSLSSNVLCSKCVLTRENLVLHILSPLIRAAQKNNFNSVLSKKMFQQYKSDLMTLVKDRHLYLQNIMKNIHCTITEYYTSIEEITEIAEAVYDFWLYKVLYEYTEAIKACLEICYKYKQKFISDNYRVGRIEVRIGKYQDYLANLERRFIANQVAIERRLNK